MRLTVLLVEDEPAIAANVEYALRTDGFDVVHVTLASDAEATLFDESATVPTIAAVVLDVGLPDGSGFELCKRIRRVSTVPILFVTARGDEVDRIVGLEIGADDYIVKPFSPRELVVRVRTVLRRSAAAAATPGIPTATPNAIAPFVVDAARATVFLSGTALVLTRYEYLLLVRLLSAPERVFTRDELLQDIGAAAASMERTIDTHIKSLRAKLRSAAPSLDPIRTHRGMGYSVRISRLRN